MESPLRTPWQWRILLFALILAEALGSSVACGAQGARTPPTGLRGAIMKGPMCPGPQRKGHPCPDAPVAAVFQVLDASGAVVATFRSDETGRFQVDLPAGSYTIAPGGQAGPRNPLGGSAHITVRAGEEAEVALHWDTGMR